MKIYYTGATKYLQAQVDPSASLGGYISSTEIPNGILANVFDQISQELIKRNVAEYRVLAIKNDGVSTLTSVVASLGFPLTADSDSTFVYDSDWAIGYAVAKVDDCGDLYIDRIGSPNAIPHGVTFTSNPLSLPNIPAGGYLIVYVRRTLNASLQTPPATSDLLAILEGTKVLPTREDIELNFSWA